MTPQEFYRCYPKMRPFVGARYERRLAEDASPRLLLVGESHYLPHGATLHLDPQRWYSAGEAELEREQAEWVREHPDEADDWVAWIDTRGVVRSACTTNFRRRGHWIWKHAFETINDAGPRHLEARCVGDDVAFFNFFARPAPRSGGSLRHHLSSTDVRLANDLFAHRLHELRPTAIAFISRLARDNLDNAIELDVPSVVTPHPTSHWWNRPSKRYGDLRGRDILQRFIVQIWPRATEAGP